MVLRDRRGAFSPPLAKCLATQARSEPLTRCRPTTPFSPPQVGAIAISPIAPLPFSRSDASATALPDGLIYIAGGCDGAQNCAACSWNPDALCCACSSVTNNMVAYSPATDTYIAKPHMPRTRYRHAACALGGAVLMFGGKTLVPDANFSTPLNPYPGNTGSLKDSNGALSAVDMYTLASGAWTTLSATYPLDLGSDNACATLGSTVYLSGGYSEDYTAAFATTYKFTLDAGGVGTFTPLLGTMRTPRGDFSLAAVGGQLYAWGGYTPYSACGTYDWVCCPLPTMELYSPGTDTWELVPTGNLTVPSAEKDDAVVIGGVLYAVGGETKSKTSGCQDTDIVPLTKILSFDPAQPLLGWREEPAALPIAKMRYSTEVLGGRAFVFGGQGALIDFDTLPVDYTAFVFDPKGAAGAAGTPPGVVAGAVIGSLLALALGACACVAVRRRGAAGREEALQKGGVALRVEA